MYSTVEHQPDLARTLLEMHRELRTILAAVARRFELTVQQFELLCTLDRHRNPSFGELADLLGCDKTNVTGLVDRLVLRELVARAPDPEDRRRIRLRLTLQGSNLGALYRDAVAEAVQERWRTLSPVERSALARFAYPGTSGPTDTPASVASTASSARESGSD